MKKTLVAVLAIFIIFLGYLVVNRNARDEATFIESLWIALDKDYETDASKKIREVVKNVHAGNIRAFWGKDYAVLKTNFKNPYILIENNESIDYIEELKKEENNPILNKDVNELFDFDHIQIHSYQEMVKKGFMSTTEGKNSTMREGDYIAVIEPNKNSPDVKSIESFVILYRKNEDGKWMGVAGYR